MFGAGEWWRVFLAPLLHQNFGHLLMNVVVLVGAGQLLEPVVGRRWLSGIFCFSLLGSIAGSLMCNPLSVATLGSSGGMAGLCSCLFVVSFHRKADELSNRNLMLKLSLLWGAIMVLPAVCSLFGISIPKFDHIDHFGHAGGALAGAMAGLVFVTAWPAGRQDPSLAWSAGGVAALYIVCAVIAGYVAGIQNTGFKRQALWNETSGFEPALKSAEPPPAIKPTVAQSKDNRDVVPVPRANRPDQREHLSRGLRELDQHHFGAAEQELRLFLDLTGTDSAGRDIAAALLAKALKEQGRDAEARQLAANLCKDAGSRGVLPLLSGAKLCPGDVPRKRP